MSRPSSWTLAVLIGSLLVGFGLRARMLPRGNLGFDGGLAAALAASPLDRLLELSARDVHPPLYYLALKAWWALAGPGVPALLWPSLALGTLSIASAWRLGMRGGGPPAAGFAAVLLALSPLHVFDGMAARDFAALVPLSLLSTLVLLEWSRCRAARPRHGLALALLYAVGLLTSYYFVATLLAHAVWVAARRVPVLRWSGLAAPGLLMLLAWAALSAVRIGPTLLSGERPTAGNAPPLVATGLELLHATVGGELPDVVAFTWLALGLAAVGLIVVRVRRRQLADGQGALPVGTLLAVGFLAALAAAGATAGLWLREVAPARYSLAVLPFALPLVALGYGGLVRAVPRLAPVLAAVAVVPLLVGLWLGRAPPPLPPAFWNPGGLVRSLDRETSPNDAVVFISLEQAGYYAATTQAPRTWRVLPIGPRYLQGDLAAEAERHLAPLVADRRRVFLVLYQGGIAPDHRVLREYLARQAYALAVGNLADSQLVTYLADPTPARPLAPGPVAAYPGASLESVGVAGVVLPDGAVGLELTWLAAPDGTGAVLQRPYRVFVHLLDGRGERMVAQHDGAPLDGLRPTHTWRAGESIVDRRAIEIPATASAPFSLLIGLYDEAGRLARIDDSGDAVRLPLE